MIPPFGATLATAPVQTVILFRNCTSRTVSLSGAVDIHFYQSAAGAARLEESGPVPVGVAFDYFTPGNPEDDKRMAPVALEPGQIAHVLLAYYDHGEHMRMGYLAETRLKETPRSCRDIDVVSVESFAGSRVIRTPMHVCGSVYVSEYRRGPFVRGERISAAFLQGTRQDRPGETVTGLGVASAALDKQTDIGLRDCAADDLDVGFDAPDRAMDPASMVFHLQNIAARSCVIWRAPGIGFIKGDLFDPAGVRSCVNCTADDREDFQKRVPEVILSPQGRARVTARFKTTSMRASDCQRVDAINFSVADASRVLPATFRFGSGIPVCSRVDVTPVTPEDPNTAAPTEPTRISLRLMSDRTTYYDGERIILHVVAKGPADLLTVDDHSCLRLVERSRSPNGSTRLDPALFQACRASSVLPLWSDRVVEMDIDAGHRTRWGGLGEHMIDVAYLAPSGPHEGAYLAKSNIQHLTIADASLIPRKWGTQTKGIAVDVTLDKDTYALGQDIAVHAAVENFAADTSIYSYPGSCYPVVNIEVRDAVDGLLVRQRTGSPFGRACSGPGFGLAQYSPGKVVAQELTLEEEGWLPAYPGDFTVSASWTVYSCQLCDLRTTKPYAIASSSPRTFRIIDPGHPELDRSPRTGVLDAKRATRFEQVDTPFGVKSALKDVSTGLKWLHLDITAGMSYGQVIAELKPGGRFDGWRYATAAELREFFSHFDGEPDGYSTDPSLQAQLQRNIGGPLTSSSNPATGWRRTSSEGLLDERFGLGHAIAGYIAEDSATGSVIDPKVTGSATDSAAPPHIASYLVQKN